MVNQSIDEKKYMDKISCEGIDSKALLVCLIQYIPKLILFALAGAVLGSGLNLIVVFMTQLRIPEFVAETEYYVEFAQGQLEAKNYYNDYTWNDVVATDEILGVAMADIGSEYDRSQIKNMITADILSDVRYLTITIRGTDEKLVGNVSKAIEKALAGFGELKKEFDSIYKIEDLGIQKEKVEIFAWRAALLGAMVVAFITLFIKIFRFSMGDSFYTKYDITKYLGIPVYGLLYSKNNKSDGTQEKMLISGLKKVLKNKETIYLLNVADVDLKKNLNELSNIDKENSLLDKIAVLSEKDYEKTKDIVVLVPFGKVCREQIKDMIVCVEQHDYRVIGAVITNVDKKWAELYYGKEWL